MTACNPTVDAFLWESLVAGTAAQVFPARAPFEIKLPEVIAITPAPLCEPAVPAGMFNQWPLVALLQNRKPFTGLAVLIDVVLHFRASPDNEGLLGSVSDCVAEMLGKNDFGCRTTGDEFVLICSGIQGRDAQRRLNNISERLWLQQQRSQGLFSLLFSWGGIATEGKPLSDAVASAVTRMNKINPQRNMISMGSVLHRTTV